MKLVGAALLAFLLPSVAAGQNGVFVQGGPLVDFRFTPVASGDPTILSLPTPTFDWNDLNRDGLWQPGEEGSISFPSYDLRQIASERTAPGASVAIGAFVAPSVSVSLEASFAGGHVTTVASDSPTLIQSQETTIRQTATASDFAVTAGWHQGQSRRATITYLAGMVFRRQTQETTLTFDYSAPRFITGIQPVMFNIEEQFESTSYSAGVMAGVDVALKLSDHVALVPQVRMIAANNDWNLRPAIVVRWRP